MPDRLEHRPRPRGPPPACGSPRGRRPCRGRASALISGRRISAIRSSSASSSTISRPWNAPTTSAVRSSAVGPRPPLVTTRSMPSRAKKRSAPRMSSRPVADDRDVREVDAELAQPLGEPRAVAVGDAPGEDLGAGDDDARAGAHAQVGRSAGPQHAAAVARDDVADRAAETSGTSRALPLIRITTALLPSVILKRFDAERAARAARRERLAARCSVRPRASTRQT